MCKKRMMDKSRLFETFLKYSDEKEKTAKVLGELLAHLDKHSGANLLDVGSGKGGLLCRALINALPRKVAAITLLEPDPWCVAQLQKLKKEITSASIDIECLCFEEHAINKQYDVIIASHVPFKKRTVRSVYNKMLEALAPSGLLIIIVRGRDDVHEFREKSISMLAGHRVRSFCLDDSNRALSRLPNLAIEYRQVKAKLSWPSWKSSDYKRLVEFLLNVRWRNLTQWQQNEIRSFVVEHDQAFRILDIVILVRKRKK